MSGGWGEWRVWRGLGAGLCVVAHASSRGRANQKALYPSMVGIAPRAGRGEGAGVDDVSSLEPLV